jgi:hypothetical protein
MAEEWDRFGGTEKTIERAHATASKFRALGLGGSTSASRPGRGSRGNTGGGNGGHHQGRGGGRARSALSSHGSHARMEEIGGTGSDWQQVPALNRGENAHLSWEESTREGGRGGGQQQGVLQPHGRPASTVMGESPYPSKPTAAERWMAKDARMTWKRAIQMPERPSTAFISPSKASKEMIREYEATFSKRPQHVQVVPLKKTTELSFDPSLAIAVRRSSKNNEGGCGRGGDGGQRSSTSSRASVRHRPSTAGGTPPRARSSVSSYPPPDDEDPRNRPPPWKDPAWIPLQMIREAVNFHKNHPMAEVDETTGEAKYERVR